MKKQGDKRFRRRGFLISLLFNIFRLFSLYSATSPKDQNLFRIARRLSETNALKASFFSPLSPIFWFYITLSPFSFRLRIQTI